MSCRFLWPRGVKFNCANGGPAPESLTDAIYANTQNIAQYKIAAHVTWPGIDLSKIGKSKIDSFEVEVVDPIADYADLLKSIFDFEVLKGLCVFIFPPCATTSKLVC